MSRKERKAVCCVVAVLVTLVGAWLAGWDGGRNESTLGVFILVVFGVLFIWKD